MDTNGMILTYFTYSINTIYLYLLVACFCLGLLIFSIITNISIFWGGIGDYLGSIRGGD